MSAPAVECVLDFVGEQGAVEDGIAVLQDGGFYHLTGYGKTLDAVAGSSATSGAPGACSCLTPSGSALDQRHVESSRNQLKGRHGDQRHRARGVDRS